MYDVGIEGMIYNYQTYYFDKNTLGDVVAIRNQQGEVVAEYEYDAWGNITYQSGYMAENNPFRYRGYYYDEETGFYYLQTRYYDPETCRFINADDYELIASLSEIPGQLNLYAYCNNNPIMYTDPSGEWALFDDIIAAIVGAVVNVLGQVVSDVITSIGTGNWQFSSWETYVGAAVGGAIGGLTSLYLGPYAGGFVAGFTSTFIGDGLESLTGKNYRSIQDISSRALLNGSIGILTSNIRIFNDASRLGNSAMQSYFRNGITNRINYFIQTSLNKITKDFTFGWMLGSGLQGIINVG